MYGYNAMEVQEAFVKIKEQAKAYLDMPGEATAGGGQGRQEQLAAGAAARMQQTLWCYPVLPVTWHTLPWLLL